MKFKLVKETEYMVYLNVYTLLYKINNLNH